MTPRSFIVVLGILTLLFPLLLLGSTNPETKADTVGNDPLHGYVSAWNYTVHMGGSDSRATSVSVDSKNNIIVVGNGRTGGKYYWNITKFDERGNATWFYAYNPGIFGEPLGVAVDSQDSFVVVGYDKTTLPSGDFEWRILKFNSTNSKLWEITYNITSGYEQPTGVAIDHDNNIIVVGGYNASAKVNDYGWWIAKFDTNGKQLWNSSFNFSPNDDWPNGVAVDSNNNIVVVGFDNMTGHTSYGWGVVKLDKNGNTLWQYHDDVSSSTDEAKGVAIDHDNNLVVAGYDRLPGLNDSEWRVMKFDSNGKSLWNYTDNPSTATQSHPDFEFAFGVAVDNYDNNVTVVGCDQFTSDYEWRIIRLGCDGRSLSSTSMKFSQSADVAHSAIADHNDDLIIVGYDGSLGNSNWQWRIMKFTSLNPKPEFPYLLLALVGVPTFFIAALLIAIVFRRKKLAAGRRELH